MATRPGTSRSSNGGRRDGSSSTRQQLLTAAADLFAQQGYPSTSMDQIAAEVGIHKSTIFHYFSGKEDLLADVLDAGLSHYVSSLEAIASRSSDPLARLDAATRNHLDFVLRHGRDLRIFLRERHHLSGARGEAYLRMSERYQATFTGLIAEGIESGALLPGDPALLSLFLLGSANWVVEWFSPGGRLTAEEVTEAFVESLIYNMMASQRRSE